MEEEALLRRQNQGLRELIADAEKGTLFSPEHLVVGVDEALARALLRAGLPQERTVGRFRVRVEEADVRFRSTQSVVTLGGRVATAEDPETFVDLTLLGGLDRLEVDSATATLTARVVIDRFEVQRAEAGGSESAVAKSVIAGLAERGLSSLADLVPRLEIPVRLDHELNLTGFGDGPVSVRPARLPIQVAVARVLPLGGRLWVMLQVSAGPWTRRATEAAR